MGIMAAWMPVPGPGPPSAAVPPLRFWMAGPGDAALLALKETLDRETSFMLLEPGEHAPGTLIGGNVQRLRADPAGSRLAQIDNGTWQGVMSER